MACCVVSSVVALGVEILLRAEVAALFVVGPGEVVVALLDDAIDHPVGLPLVVELHRVAGR